MIARLRALALAGLVVAVGAITPSAAHADPPAAPPSPQQLPSRQANYAWTKTAKGNVVLSASFSFRDMLDDPAMQQKLASGLPTVIAMRAYVLRDGAPDPVALAVRTCRVVYDLWDEVYRIKVSDPAGDRDIAAFKQESVIRNCGEARDLVVADRSLLVAGKPHFLGVIAEVDPVSPQMLDQMRKWVSRPAGSTGIGPGDALFGSFVGLFVRQIGTAARTLRFRTQEVTP